MIPFAQTNVTQPSPLAVLPLFIIIFLIFYFLLIRPQQKEQKRHQKMIESLKKNDKIVTIGGIHGVIQDVKKDTILIKVDDDTKLLIDKHAVARVKKDREEG
jgi:preprotein translocase subunit YajC